MTERDALLRAIYENPGDDAPRLIYADWLDEHGDPQQAEFIRLQMQYSPVNFFQADAHPTSPRQIELYKDIRKWRYARADWASLTVDNFVRGFCSSWSGTPSEFLRIAPNYWRLGPVDHASIYIWKKLDVKILLAEQIAECEWLGKLRSFSISGQFLTEEWVLKILTSPYACNWTVLRIDGSHLTDQLCERMARIEGLRGIAVVDVYSPQITPHGHATIDAAFPRQRKTAED